MCSQRSTLSKQNILELGMTTKMSYMWHAIFILLCISHYSYCIKTMFHPKAIFEYPFELLLLFFCVWFDIQILSNDYYYIIIVIDPIWICANLIWSDLRTYIYCMKTSILIFSREIYCIVLEALEYIEHDFSDYFSLNSSLIFRYHISTMCLCTCINH